MAGRRRPSDGRLCRLRGPSDFSRTAGLPAPGCRPLFNLPLLLLCNCMQMQQGALARWLAAAKPASNKEKKIWWRQHALRVHAYHLQIPATWIPKKANERHSLGAKKKKKKTPQHDARLLAESHDSLISLPACSGVGFGGGMHGHACRLSPPDFFPSNNGAVGALNACNCKSITGDQPGQLVPLHVHAHAADLVAAATGSPQCKQRTTDGRIGPNSMRK